MFWNANNTYGFDKINWGRLAFTTTITTVSKYMKNIMQGMGQGLRPMVIPNGIPSILLKHMDNLASNDLRMHLPAETVLSKVARWDEDKRWDTAVDTVAQLKERGKKPVLLARGGIEPYGAQILEKARTLNLQVREVYSKGDTLKDYLEAIESAGQADILNLRFHCPPELLRLIYHTSDAVLANSSHEPFGLVGLETMAAGGVAFTGSTGEDYAIPFHNSIVLETTDPKEMVVYLSYLKDHPDMDKNIRRMAKETARIYTWERIIDYLIRKLEYRARAQGIMASEPKKPAPEPLADIRPLDLEINIEHEIEEAYPGKAAVPARRLSPALR
jgi:glycosyltransferase involved in cell wall biosynthesis